MKTILYIFACVFTLTEAAVSDAEWEAFKRNYNKSYESLEEEVRRMSIYASNKRAIEAHNKRYAIGFTTYTKGVNQFTDREMNELPGYSILSPRFRFEGLKSVNVSEFASTYTPVGSAPIAIDWRKYGVVTRVKNEYDCETAWAFSTTGSIESQVAIMRKRIVELSEGQLVDCVSRTHGIHRNRRDAFSYIIQKAGGIEYEADYPYVCNDDHRHGRYHSCIFDGSKAETKLSGIKFIPAGDENALQDAVANIGPISIAVDPNGLHYYHGGIFENKWCSNYRLHLPVLVVGYGTEGGIPYWIIKNSWGPYWGEQGYFRIRRFAGNMCGVATEGIFPVLQ